MTKPGTTRMSTRRDNTASAALIACGLQPDLSALKRNFAGIDRIARAIFEVHVGYLVGSVSYWRPDGVVQRNVPSGSWSTFQRGCCLSLWSCRHFGSALHKHVRPPAS